MSFQAYIDTIKTRTGKTPADFKTLAERKGLLEPGVKVGQITAWLKEDFGLGHGHAMAIVLTLQQATQPAVSKDERVEKHFGGARTKWREPYQRLLSSVRGFGPGVAEGPTSSYISLLRKGKKFAIVQVTADRMDVGIKLKGIPAPRRLQAAGSWNTMVTHRVGITSPAEIDDQLLSALKLAFDRA
jgi:hypothetical protein